MTTKSVGVAYGTVGVIFLTIGGIIGGLFASKVGLKKALWLMALGMTLPCLSFVYLAIYQPTNIWVISVAIAIEQFGYGFGFTAYMLYISALHIGRELLYLAHQKAWCPLQRAVVEVCCNLLLHRTCYGSTEN